jgi:WD repeat-containing protein 35
MALRLSLPNALSRNPSHPPRLRRPTDSVVLATWNAPFKKLTTADDTGLIIVWTLHKGVWYEEMVNNRNKSVVRDLRWRGNGTEICIIYEDGMVIVGTVDGNRLSSKDFGCRLSLVEWAPSGQTILFVTAEGPVHIHNHVGVRVGEVQLKAISDLLPSNADLSSPMLSPEIRVVAIEWYDGAEGYLYPNCHSLALAFANGRVQLMRDASDESPVCIDTSLSPLSTLKWNSNGSAFAVVGQRSAGNGRDFSEVQFYSPDGRFLHSLKVPGGTVGSLSWEGGGLRVAVRTRPAVTLSLLRLCVLTRTLPPNLDRLRTALRR